MDNNKIYKKKNIQIMVRCSVLGCKSDSGRKMPHLSFHSFPEHDILRHNWIVATGRSIWSPKPSSKICSKHFVKDSFIKKKKLTLLLPNAVPILTNTTTSERSLENDSLTDSSSSQSAPLSPTTTPDKFTAENTSVTVFKGHVPKRSQKIEAASSRKQTEAEINKSKKSSKKDAFSWEKKKSENALQDEVVRVDDSPDDLSMYCDDETSDDNNRTDRHDGFHCNICNGDIFGYRYTCVQCSELDLCASCESIGAHAQHYMLRVPGPRPYVEIQTVLSRIRKYLLKNSDPISSTADFDSEETVSLKSEIKSENEENDVEDVQQVDAVTKNELEPGENSSPLPCEPQCSKDTNCELTLPNNNTAGVQHVKILLTGLMDEKKNRKLLIVKSNDKTDPILTSTAKRKIVGNSPDSGEPKGLAQVAKRLCVMPNTNKQNIKQTITVCSQNVEPEQTNLKYLIIPSNIVPLQIRSPKKPQTNTAGENS